jgi:hypothetical protein
MGDSAEEWARAEAAKAADAAEALIGGLHSFLMAKTSADSERALESHPDVMSDGRTDRLLAKWINDAAKQGDSKHVRFLERRRRLLSRCRDVGIRRAFAEYDKTDLSRRRTRAALLLICGGVVVIAALLLLASLLQRQNQVGPAATALSQSSPGATGALGESNTPGQGNDPGVNPSPGQSTNPAPGQSNNPAPGQSNNPAPGQSNNPAPGQSNPGPSQSSPTLQPSPDIPMIVNVARYTVGALVYVSISYTDGDGDAQGFGFRGVNGSGWAAESHPFSNPSYGRVSPGRVDYPFNLACGQANHYESDVEFWISDSGGRISNSVVAHIAC